MFNKKNILDSLSRTLPDDRPITSLQIVESSDKCPQGFYVVNKTYDQDQDADLWREGSTFLKKKSIRYLCLSKTDGLPDFVVSELVILNEKALPPEGYSLLNRTADSEQKAWRKKQICYRLVNRRTVNSAVTDIIVCSRLKKAPEGFVLAGEINGVIVCYKMGNVQDTQAPPADYTNGNPPKVPERPPKPAAPNPTGNAYPSLGDSADHDYEILMPGNMPSRPAPRAPPPQFTHQTSTHNTLSSGHSALEGVPFVLNPRFRNSNPEKIHFPVVKARKMSQLLKDYNYDFRLERQT